MFLIYTLLIFVLASWGLTQVLVRGHIFDRIRPKAKFFHCPMCIGFWSGFVLFWAFLLISGLMLFPCFYLGSIVMGFISSATSYFLCNLVDDEGIKTRTKIIFIDSGDKSK